MNFDDASMSGEDDHNSEPSDTPLYPPGGHPPGPPPRGPTRVRITGPFIDPDEQIDPAPGPTFPPDTPPGGQRDIHLPEPLAHTPPTPTDNPTKKGRWTDPQPSREKTEPLSSTKAQKELKFISAFLLPCQMHPLWLNNRLIVSWERT